MKQHLPLLLVLLLLASCRESTKTGRPDIDPGFTSYVSGFTTGVVSAASPVRVRLMNEIPDSLRKALTDPHLFKFKPSLQGQVRWSDAQTIEFVPDDLPGAGTGYQCEFQLGKILAVPPALQTLEFQFQIMKQALFAEVQGLSSWTRRTFAGSSSGEHPARPISHGPKRWKRCCEPASKEGS
ncbi:MAG: hypothetical protein R2751_07570 [Bacteroidales bacterium]